MFDVVQDDAGPLERARAALRLAERRVGVQHRDQVVTVTPPAPAPLTDLLPDGELPRGAVSSVLGPGPLPGSASLTCWLLGATQGDRWIAVAGWPNLSPLAMTEAGVNLSRVMLVPDVQDQGPAILAALIGGFETVVVGPRVQLTPSERRRLLARARQQETAVLSTSRWEGAALTLDVERSRWSGPDRGERWLREARLTVTRHSSVDGGGQRFDVARSGTASPTVIAARVAGVRLTG